MGRYQCEYCSYYEDGIFEHIYVCTEGDECFAVGNDRTICQDCMKKRLEVCSVCKQKRCMFCMEGESDVCVHCDPDRPLTERELSEQRANAERERLMKSFMQEQERKNGAVKSARENKPKKNKTVKASIPAAKKKKNKAAAESGEESEEEEEEGVSNE